MRNEIKSHMMDYIDEFSPDIDVVYDDDESKYFIHGHVVVDDGIIKYPKHFK